MLLSSKGLGIGTAYFMSHGLAKSGAMGDGGTVAEQHMPHHFGICHE